MDVGALNFALLKVFDLKLNDAVKMVHRGESVVWKTLECGDI